MATKELVKFAFTKLTYEFTGTMILTIVWLTDNSAGMTLFFSLWILNAFIIRVSGAHMNPAVSFAYSMRKDDKGISRKMALVYIIA